MQLVPNISLPTIGIGSFNPSFNTGIGSFNPAFNVGFAGLGVGTSGSSNSSSSAGIKKGETYDEYMARKEKNRAKNESEYKKLQDEINACRASIEEVEEVVKKANTAKVDKETGELKCEETMEDYKKQPWWKKTLRAGANMVQGVWSLATELVGYEQNPETGERKWNWKKCLKNAAIAVGCIALTCIPGVGPFISAGLLASGVIAGSIGVGKGVALVRNAERPEDIDKGFQEIGKGLVVTGTSAMGLRGLGKGFRVANGVSAKGNFLQDMTVNAFKAAKSAAAADRSAIAAMRNQGVKGAFWKQFGVKIKTSLPKFGRKKMEGQVADTKNSIDSRIREIDARMREISTQNPSEESMLEEALLKQEKVSLTKMKNSIDKLTTKQDWETFSQKNKVAELKTKLDNYTAGDKIKVKDPTGRKIDYSLAEKDFELVDSFSSRLGEYTKQATELAKTRETSMKWMSLSGKNRNPRMRYDGYKLKSNIIGRLWDFVRPAPKQRILGKIWNCISFPFSTALKIMGLPFRAWELTKKSPATAFFKFESTVVNPIYEEAWLRNAFGMGEQALTSVGKDGKPVSIIQDGKAVALADENGNAVALTKKDLDDLKDYLEKAKQKIENNVKKQNELYA